MTQNNESKAGGRGSWGFTKPTALTLLVVVCSEPFDWTAQSIAVASGTRVCLWGETRNKAKTKKEKKSKHQYCLHALFQ
jgi:hypothetical protein